MKNDARSRSEVYYEIAVMYTDAEEFDKAKTKVMNYIMYKKRTEYGA